MKLYRNYFALDDLPNYRGSTSINPKNTHDYGSLEILIPEKQGQLL